MMFLLSQHERCITFFPFYQSCIVNSLSRIHTLPIGLYVLLLCQHRAQRSWILLKHTQFLCNVQARDMSFHHHLHQHNMFTSMQPFITRSSLDTQQKPFLQRKASCNPSLRYMPNLLLCSIYIQSVFLFHEIMQSSGLDVRRLRLCCFFFGST